MTEAITSQDPDERTRVGFPKAPEDKKSFNFKIFFILFLVLLLIGIGFWFMMIRNKSLQTTTEETPTPVEEITETATPTPETINRKNVKLQILNGSGISGAAGKLQGVLESAGYSQITVGNADSYSFTTTLVVFDKTVSQDIRDDITDELEKLYGKVETTEKSSARFDAVITIGYPKGFSPSPSSKTSSTPTPKASAATLTPTKKVSTTLTPTP